MSEGNAGDRRGGGGGDGMTSYAPPIQRELDTAIVVCLFFF